VSRLAPDTVRAATQYAAQRALKAGQKIVSHDSPVAIMLTGNVDTMSSASSDAYHQVPLQCVRPLVASAAMTSYFGARTAYTRTSGATSCTLCTAGLSSRVGGNASRAQKT
jgi:hypothetical protein